MPSSRWDRYSGRLIWKGTQINRMKGWRICYKPGGLAQQGWGSGYTGHWHSLNIYLYICTYIELSETQQIMILGQNLIYNRDILSDFQKKTCIPSFTLSYISRVINCRQQKRYLEAIVQWSKCCLTIACAWHSWSATAKNQCAWLLQYT